MMLFVLRKMIHYGKKRDAGPPEIPNSTCLHDTYRFVDQLYKILSSYFTNVTKNHNNC